MRHRQALLTLCASLAPQVPRRYWTDVYQRLEASVIRASVIRASVIRPNMVNSTACLSHRPDEFFGVLQRGHPPEQTVPPADRNHGMHMSIALLIWLCDTMCG